ncbi:MAG: hypothetical protein AABY22_13745 [Nanoarchaeota archaeon]
MLEKSIKKTNMKFIVYLIGIILEILGFSLLFAFDKTMNLIHQYPLIFSISTIIMGYFVAISGRRIK